MAERTEIEDHEHVNVAVEDAPSPGFEHVPARRIREGEWELLRSPLYAMGVAAGDVVRVLNGEKGAIEVVTRGGNVCVQLYLCERDANDAKATDQVASTIELDIAAMGGRVDGQTPGLITFTLPVAVGFPAIERVFMNAIRRYPGAEWQYSNVYDSITGAPLGWWE